MAKFIGVSAPECFNLATRDLDEGKLASTNSAPVNTAIIQLAQDRQGAGLGARVRKPLYLPGGRFYIDELLLGVNDAHTGAKQGLQILTAGGTGIGVNTNAASLTMGNITRLTYVGGKDDNEAAITYHGAGLWLGPLELCGIDLVTGDHYLDRNKPEVEGGFTKTPVGIRITSLKTPGAPNGRIQASGLLLQGFHKGIEVYQDDTGGNNDNLTWHFLDMDACDIGYEINSSQSVTHLVYKVHTNYFVDTIFKVIKGGDLHCWSCQINNPDCTILDMSEFVTDAGYHYGNFEVRNVRIDPVANNPVLLKLSDYTTVPRNVIITGSVSSDVTYTAGDLVQNANENDRIFIRFTGPAQAVADFNGCSTVAEAPF